MNFKRFLSCTVAAMLMCGVLAGCKGGGNKNADTTTQDTTDATQAAAEFKAGTRTDKEYTSEWLRIKYTLPEDYIMMTDDQLNQAMQIGAENIYEDSETGENMVNYAQINSVYEMAATKTTTGESVMIIAEKMNINLSEAQYEQAFKSQLKSTTMSPEYKETTIRTVAGIDFTDVSYSFTQNGITVNQAVLLKNMGDRMVIITFTYRYEDTLTEMLAGFSKL